MKKVISILLLAIICLCMTACGSSASNNENHSVSIATSNANGYDSIDELVDFYIRTHTGQSVSKDEVQKMYPQEIWDNWQDYRDHSLDDSYLAAQQDAAAIKEKYTEKYGSDYKVSYSIDETTEVQSGVYEVTVTVTITGSLRSQEATNYIMVRKMNDKWYGY